jgi:hypothetical protein
MHCVSVCTEDMFPFLLRSLDILLSHALLSHHRSFLTFHVLLNQILQHGEPPLHVVLQAVDFCCDGRKYLENVVSVSQ